MRTYTCKGAGCRADVSATAITGYHRTSSGFRAWVERAAETAGRFNGYLSCGISDQPEPVSHGMSVTFDSADDLHRWLESGDRRDLERAAAATGILAQTSDLVLVDGVLPPPGIGVYDHVVVVGKENEFLRTQRHLIDLSSRFSGYESVMLLRSVTDSTQWKSVLRFRTEQQLAEWMASPERAAALPKLRAELAEDFTETTRSTPFGTILRTENGQTRATPNWKTAMIILLVLYPTVMTLSRFLGPLLDGIGAPPWLSMWLSQIVSVGAMTWFLMPTVTRWFRHWLDPVDGAVPRTNWRGVAAVIAVYVVTLTLFASVKWLQFWDYFD